MNRVLLLLCMFAFVGGCTCAKHEPAQRGERASSEWASGVRSAHELADQAKSQTQRQAAITALRQALQSAPSTGNDKVQWVVQDLHFRLAQALADNNDLADAQTVIGQGLGLASESTLTRANLLALQGKIYEAQGKPEQAAATLHEALLINEVLMDRALAGEVESERR